MPRAISIADDHRTIMVTLGAERPISVRLDAQSLDDLVAALGEARRQLEPPLPPDWPFKQASTTVVDPRWTTEPDPKTDSTLLHLRDPRFGWLHYAIPHGTAGRLGELLVTQAKMAAAPSK